ncbi:protein FAR1-RELATED SEQUENCE 8-like [Cicer arietinum]|uniref:protein FAR1-RELATED SEQUENCE 8-like n=1 Tax=Cicer arietinum TaxID=3827 RepID=UPI003CC6BC27
MGPRTDMQHLLKLLEAEKYTCWSRTHEDSNVVRDMFWTHTDSITLLNMFPLVLIMDSTYKTNKYRLPLFEIVGVTSTWLTFNVAFAYMDSERQDNFWWALEKLKELFFSNTPFPQVIVTDRELALMNAIKVVFPSSTNLLCQLHINKNVGAKCKQYILKKDMQEPILELWRKIVYCSEEKEYEELLQVFEQACVDNIMFFDYVRDTWLNPHKERFVEAWTNRVLHLGNTTTNRVESAHWSLKRFLEHSKGDFCKAWNGMNDMLKFQIIKIKGSFEISKGRKEHIHNNPFFEKLTWVVSKKALGDIVEEYKRVSYVGNDKDVCCCILRKTHGLPCAYIVNVKADGNCGYRAIAALLGYGEEYWSIIRRQLYTEIKSKPDLYAALFKERLQEVTESLLVTELENQGNEKWMTIPDMGYDVYNIGVL